MNILWISVGIAFQADGISRVKDLRLKVRAVEYESLMKVTGILKKMITL